MTTPTSRFMSTPRDRVSRPVEGSTSWGGGWLWPGRRLITLTLAHHPRRAVDDWDYDSVYRRTQRFADQLTKAALARPCGSDEGVAGGEDQQPVDVPAAGGAVVVVGHGATVRAMVQVGSSWFVACLARSNYIHPGADSMWLDIACHNAQISSLPPRSRLDHRSSSANNGSGPTPALPVSPNCALIRVQRPGMESANCTTNPTPKMSLKI